MMRSRFLYAFVNDCNWTIKQELIPSIIDIFPISPLVVDNDFVQSFMATARKSGITLDKWCPQFIEKIMPTDVINDMLTDRTGVWIGHNILDDYYPVMVFDSNTDYPDNVYKIMRRYNRFIFNNENDEVFATLKYGAIHEF